MAFSPDECRRIDALLLKDYRWQYIVSSTMEPRSCKVLLSLLAGEQAQRVRLALEPLAYARPQRLDLPMAA